MKKLTILNLVLIVVLFAIILFGGSDDTIFKNSEGRKYGLKIGNRFESGVIYEVEQKDDVLVLKTNSSESPLKIISMQSAFELSISDKKGGDTHMIISSD